MVETIEELIGISGDAENPLTERAPHDGVFSNLAFTIDDLFVGEDSAKFGAPVDRTLVDVGEACFKELEEDPLGPAVVLGVGRVDFARPIEGEAEAFELSAEIIDILGGGDGRVGTCFDRILFGGKSKGVPANGVEHIVTGGKFVAGEDIIAGEIFGMTRVEAGTAGIGKHLEQVILGLVGTLFCCEGFIFLPITLPVGLDF